MVSEFSGKDEDKLRAQIMDLLMKSFRPEFLNRLDTIIIYHRLTPALISQIVDMQLGRVAERLIGKKIKLTFTPALKKHVAEAGYDPVYGARPLKRVIQDEIVDELALSIIENKFDADAHVHADYKNNKVVLTLPN
jgi:ATP-dependent Clp protease ATP-binding subunit ClpB